MSNAKELEYLKRLAGLSTKEGRDEGNDEAQKFQNYYKIVNGNDTIPFAILYHYYSSWRGSEALSISHFGIKLNKYLKRTRTSRKGKDVRAYKINKIECLLDLNNEPTIWKLINEKNKKTMSPKINKKQNAKSKARSF